VRITRSKLPQRRVLGQRLDGEHVDRRTADALGLHRLRQRRFVHQLAARGVDQHRGRLHQLQARGIDQMVRLLGMRHVQRDDVGLAQQLIEWKGLI